MRTDRLLALLLILASLFTALSHGWTGAWGLFFLLAAFGVLTFAGKFALGTPGLLALTLGGVGSGPSTMQALAAAFWPAMLEAPVSTLPERFSGVLGLLVAAWVVINLVRAIALGHHLGMGRTTLSLAGATLAALFRLGGLILVPLTLVVLAFA